MECTLPEQSENVRNVWQKRTIRVVKSNIYHLRGQFLPPNLWQVVLKKATKTGTRSSEFSGLKVRHLDSEFDMPTIGPHHDRPWSLLAKPRLGGSKFEAENDHQWITPLFSLLLSGQCTTHQLNAIRRNSGNLVRLCSMVSVAQQICLGGKLGRWTGETIFIFFPCSYYVLTSKKNM